MVNLWVGAAVAIAIGIGLSANYIIKHTIKQKEKNCLDITENPPYTTFDKEINDSLDKRFNDQNKNLKDFKIDISNKAKNKESNTAEDEKVLV